ncbi:MAG: hypothetical protein SF051_08400 [Elusimicrobiota bacterium]|nr:hypothetical protein [Elusimicrobiota bacterium]
MSGSARGRAAAPLAALGLLVAVYAAANAVWLSQNGLRCVAAPFHARHFARAMELCKLVDGGATPGELYATLHRDHMQPAPLRSAAACALLRASGRSVPFVSGLLGLAAFAAALAGLRLLSAELGDPPETTATALALFAAYPAVYGLSRLYGAFDLEVAAAMPFAAWLLLKTRRFESRRWSLALGVFVAAAMLVKDTFAGYFGPPLLYAAYEALRPAGARRRRAANLALLAVVAAALISPYYAHETILLKESTELIREPRAWAHLVDNLDAYGLGLSWTLLSPVFTLLFAASLYAAVRAKRDHGGDLLLWWVLVPWLIVSFMAHAKRPSYFVPILPAAALLSARWLRALAPRARATATAVCATAAVAQFALFSFGPVPSTAWMRLDAETVFHRGTALPFDAYHAAATALKAQDAAAGRRREVLVLPSAEKYGLDHFPMFEWLLDLDLDARGPTPELFQGVFMRPDHPTVYEAVLVPMPEKLDARRYAAQLHAHLRAVARKQGNARKLAQLEAWTAESFGARLESFLSGYPQRRSLGSDGVNELWLASRAPAPVRPVKPGRPARRS